MLGIQEYYQKRTKYDPFLLAASNSFMEEGNMQNDTGNLCRKASPQLMMFHGLFMWIYFS